MIIMSDYLKLYNLTTFQLNIKDMGCSGCSVGKDKDGKPGGCKSNGGCSTGGCNKLNTYDWLTAMDIEDMDGFDVVEVSFKNGAHKGFYRNPLHADAMTGDFVVTEIKGGYDIGTITLSGELVRLQMKKKKTREAAVTEKILRVANQRDMEKLDEARSMEYKTMVRARAIVATLDLKMKVGDVEYQGDKKKATFYYTADGRVDFRELIRALAKEFKVKIEMRQIGARQESALIGGIGSCGRELCCSTWLSDFKTVNTAAARYQNLAINQAKLSGMCGRLKCCLNFELDTYMDALKDFPKKTDRLMTQGGQAVLVKTDIFKRIMYFAIQKDGFRGKPVPLSVERVKEIREMNNNGEKPVNLVDLAALIAEEKKEMFDFESVNDVIELPPEERRRRRRPRGVKGRNDRKRSEGGRPTGKPKAKTPNAKTGDRKPAAKKPGGTPKKDGPKGGGTGNSSSRPRKGSGGGKRNNNKK
ncbi:MAG: cell fate regulator YaaT (PSP1 superfamily) [Saprospiraceae bacterium]|jgi:cell fate regulator YaaT (PSP1 superfamily)